MKYSEFLLRRAFSTRFLRCYSELVSWWSNLPRGLSLTSLQEEVCVYEDQSLESYLECGVKL